MHGKTVILGGGFAGLQACRILARQDGKILLIDPSPVTTMLPALPDLAGGWVPEQIVSRPLRELLPAGVDLLSAAATRLDLDQRQIVANGRPVSYDHLLIAAGSVPDFRGTVFPPGTIHALATLPDALRIRNEFAAYLSATPRPQVLVLGTGYTGLELAMSLHFRARAAGRSCAITLADPAPVLLPSLPDRQRQYVLDFLTSQGADIRLGASLDSFDGRRAVVGGRELESPFVCWAGGSTFAVPELLGHVERLRDGRLVVAPDLSLPGYPGVFAAGDAAAIRSRGQVLRKAVNFAYYGGRHAARNMLRLRHGLPARPFRPVDLGWIVPLHAASIGRLAPGFWIRGRIGVRLHHLMCGLRNYSLRHFAGCLRLALNPNQGA